MPDRFHGGESSADAEGDGVGAGLVEAGDAADGDAAAKKAKAGTANPPDSGRILCSKTLACRHSRSWC